MTYEEFYKEQYPVLLKAEEQLKQKSGKHEAETLEKGGRTKC